MTSVAIAHKDYDVRGGGEILCEQLAEMLDAPLYVGRKDGSHAPDELSQPIREIDLTRWQRWAIRRGGAPRSLAYMVAWQTAHPDLPEYDVVVASGNEPLWYVPDDDQALVAYTHSTPRFQYDLFHERDHGLLDIGYNTAVRSLYLPNVRKPDLWVANSDVVARRMNLYWDLPRADIAVVYPPVPTAEYSPDAEPTGEYYLYLGRLADHKRPQDAVETFGFRDGKLIVAGDGPERDRLEADASANVEFEGFVSEARKRKLYAGAKALVYPCENEDFGMVPIEAMAAGTPVIGVREGFTKHQVQDGENGLLYERGDLYDAIQRFERSGVAWDAHDIAAWADRWFGRERFAEEMRSVVDRAAELATVTPEWERETPVEEPAREVLIE
jgi:glycosyltransferase involved in cell wall biosynthesis